jgi:diaminopimelate epimerase
MQVVASKHHGLGNDFLVVDLDQDSSLESRTDCYSCVTSAETV